MRLDTYSARPKYNVRFYGNGFMSGEVVDVYFGSPEGKRWATVSANDRGSVAGHFTVPFISAGDYILFVVGRQSQTPTTISLNVRGFHPWVVLDTYAPAPHTRLGFTGEDFVPGEEVLVYLNRQGSANSNGPGKLVARIQVDAGGRFVVPAASWEVPELNGKYTLVFVGQENGDVVTTTFTIVS